MSSPRFESFLARIYVDPRARARFLVDPAGEARSAGLSPRECDALERIDRPGLLLAAESFERKRAGRSPGRAEKRASDAPGSPEPG